MNEKTSSLPAPEFADRDIDQLAFVFGKTPDVKKKADLLAKLETQRVSLMHEQKDSGDNLTISGAERD